MTIQEIGFEKILPLLVAITACLGIAWLLLWAMTRVIRTWVQQHSRVESSATVERWANQLRSFLRKTIAVAAFVISILILMYGVGIQGFPRLTWPTMAAWASEYLIPIAFILGSGYVVIQFSRLLIGRLPDYLSSSAGSPVEKAERRKRTESAGRLLQWLTTTIVLAVTALMVLRKAGVDTAPLLTGSAVLGVALGFGAQDLVKDIISGFFLIVENQIRVGDVVEVNGKGGLVESLRTRTIVLRGMDGTVYIIPNGSIREVSNRTMDFSYYVINLGVAYRENVDHVIATLQEIGTGLEKDPKFAPKILAPLEVLGVDDFADSSVVIKLRIRTIPLEQWGVGRELRRRIKNTFDERGIEIPYPHLSIYAGSGTKAFPFESAQTGSNTKQQSGSDGNV